VHGVQTHLSEFEHEIAQTRTRYAQQTVVELLDVPLEASIIKAKRRVLFQARS
jgi:hypothetical protein